jgi:hypothetical protein
MSDVVDELEKTSAFSRNPFPVFRREGNLVRERDSEPGKKIPRQVTIEPLGDSGHRRPYPWIPFFIFV